MKTVQMTLDESLVKELDKVVKTSRSAFTRQALQFAIDDFYIKELEKKQIEEPSCKIK